MRIIYLLVIHFSARVPAGTGLRATVSNTVALAVVRLCRCRRRCSSRRRYRGSSCRSVAGTGVFERRADVAPSNVAEDDVRCRGVLCKQGRVAFGVAARPVGAGIKPVHKLAGIVPDGERQDHTAAQCLAHGCQAAEFRRAAVGGVTRLRGDHIAVGVGGGDELAVLHIPTADGCQSARCSAVVGVELGDNCKGLGGVDCAAKPVEVGVPFRIRVETATVLIAVGIGAWVRCE